MWVRRSLLACLGILVAALAPTLAQQATPSLIHILTSRDLLTINPANGHVVAQWQVANETAVGLAATPDGATIVITGDTFITFFEVMTGTAHTQTVGTALGPPVLNPAGTQVWVADRTAGQIHVFDVATRTAARAPIAVAAQPRRLVFTLDGTRVWVLHDSATGGVTGLDPATGSIVASWQTDGGHPVAAAIFDSGTRLAIAHATYLPGSDPGSAASDIEGPVTFGGTPAVPARLSVLNLSTGTTLLHTDLPQNVSTVGGVIVDEVSRRAFVVQALSTLAPSGGTVRTTTNVPVLNVDSGTLDANLTLPQLSNFTLGNSSGITRRPNGRNWLVASAGGVWNLGIDTLEATEAVTYPNTNGRPPLALVEPARPACWFETGAAEMFVRQDGGSLDVSIPQPPNGCTWQATTSAPWIAVTPTSSSAAATVRISVGANTDPRAGVVAISGQPIRVEQLDLRGFVDAPADSSTVTLPFTVSGWGIERRVAATDSGLHNLRLVDETDPTAPIEVASAGQLGDRGDIASLYGAAYRRSGFSMGVTRLGVGTRQLAIYGQSTADSTAQRVATFVVHHAARPPIVGFDTPAQLTNGPGLRLSGYGFNPHATTACGYDRADIEAQPHAGGPAVALGTATLGVTRNDLVQHFGLPGIGTCGWSLPATQALPTGTYTLVARVRTYTPGQPDAEARAEFTVLNRPFGYVDTPIANSTVSGAINVSGWALDDGGVTRVEILAQHIAGSGSATSLWYVADAPFVSGTRPDVAGVYSAYPNATRSGWGVQVLTNMLPYGDGTYNLYVRAHDATGQLAQLGIVTVVVANTASTIPFGTIDAPAPGATVSGVVPIFGWTLTPSPAIVPMDGSTIEILVDGQVIGRPAFNQCRGTNGVSPAPGTCNDDIAQAFGTSYRNLTEGRGAIGSYLLDTTTLTNGIHELSWRVTDSLGGVQGLGSRYFHVNNPHPIAAVTPLR